MTLKTCGNCGKEFSPSLNVCPKCGTKEQDAEKRMCLLCTQTSLRSDVCLGPREGSYIEDSSPVNLMWALFSNDDGTKSIGYHRACLDRLYASIGPLLCRMCGTAVLAKDDFVKEPWKKWAECPNCAEPHPIAWEKCFYCHLPIVLAYQEACESDQGDLYETSDGFERRDAPLHESCSWYDFLGGVWSPPAEPERG